METLPAINNPYPALATVLRQQQPPAAPTAAENWLYEIRQKGQDSTYYVMVQNVKVSMSALRMSGSGPGWLRDDTRRTTRSRLEHRNGSFHPRLCDFVVYLCVCGFLLGSFSSATFKACVQHT